MVIVVLIKPDITLIVFLKLTMLTHGIVEVVAIVVNRKIRRIVHVKIRVVVVTVVIKGIILTLAEV